MKIKATPEQCQALLNARNSSSKKTLNAAIFKQIRTDKGLQGTAKLSVRNISNPNNEETYGVLFDARTRVDLDDGRQAPVVSRPKAVVAPVKAAPAPKAVPAKQAPVAAKKPVAKPVAINLTKVKAKQIAQNKSYGIPGVSPTRTDKHTIEIRTTIDGVRKRLGFASSQKDKDAAIAAAKAAA